MDGEVPETRAPEFEWSPNIGKLAGALAQAQGEIENAAADAENDHFGSRYADLASIINAVKGPLARAQIARHQALMSVPGEVGVRTSLMHVSGEWVASTVYCKFAGTPQALGSVVTYLRRYSLSAAVGLAQDDDDANAAEGKPRRKVSPTAVSPIPQPYAAATEPRARLEPKTQARIKILQGEAGISDDEWREKLRSYYKVDSSTALTEEQAADLIARLEARRSSLRGTQGNQASPKSA